MVYISSPCVLFRKDKLHEHQKTLGHIDAVKAESHAAAAKCSGGIRAAIDSQVSLKGTSGSCSNLNCVTKACARATCMCVKCV